MSAKSSLLSHNNTSLPYPPELVRRRYDRLAPWYRRFERPHFWCRCFRRDAGSVAIVVRAQRVEECDSSSHGRARLSTASDARCCFVRSLLRCYAEWQTDIESCLVTASYWRLRCDCRRQNHARYRGALASSIGDSGDESHCLGGP